MDMNFKYFGSNYNDATNYTIPLSQAQTNKMSKQQAKHSTKTHKAKGKSLVRQAKDSFSKNSGALNSGINLLSKYQASAGFSYGSMIGEQGFGLQQPGPYNFNVPTFSPTKDLSKTADKVMLSGMLTQTRIEERSILSSLSRVNRDYMNQMRANSGLQQTLNQHIRKEAVITAKLMAAQAKKVALTTGAAVLNGAATAMTAISKGLDAAATAVTAAATAVAAIPFVGPALSAVLKVVAKAMKIASKALKTAAKKMKVMARKLKQMAQKANREVQQLKAKKAPITNARKAAQARLEPGRKRLELIQQKRNQLNQALMQNREQQRMIIQLLQSKSSNNDFGTYINYSNGLNNPMNNILTSQFPALFDIGTMFLGSMLKSSGTVAL